MQREVIVSMCADGAPPLTLEFSKPPDMTGAGLDPRLPFEARWRELYGTEGRLLVRRMMKHLPGGLMDAIFAALAEEKASILKVPHHRSQAGGHDATP